MCDVGETLYDKDAVYVEMGQNVRKLDLSSGEKDILVGEGVGIVNQLVKAAAPIDEACKASTVKLFAASSGIKGSADVFEGVRSDALGTETEPNPRIRRKVVFSDVESESDSGLRWKEHMADKAEQAFLQPRPPDLMGAVYNTNHTSAINSLDESEPEDDDFFSKERHEKVGDQEIAVTEDSSKIRETGLHWDEEDVQKLLRNKFVTGEWGSEDAEKLLMEDEESDADGDFEDLEIASCRFFAHLSVSFLVILVFLAEHKAEESPRDVVQQSDRLRYEEKVLKKAEFDRMYDNKDNDGLFQEMKESFAKQARINESEFENEAAEQRIQYEGFRPGLYLRIVVENVPSEFCQHLDLSYPIIIGGLLSNEENIGFVHVRIKKHRWFPRILKNNDPLIISLGWRRFQTAMQYSMQDHNMRNRLLKYTPKHMHCRATFYGPLVTPNTGFLGVQTVDRTPGFRIAATGVVLEQDACFKVVKKLKLTGVPHKVFTNTAFIKDMFTSDLEVSKFIGASIRTVSGIRGTIKKTLSAPLGSFRATFEDKIKLSDIVFLRAWYPVEPLRYYNPVTSLLQADKGSWTGMKTVGQLRFERNLKARCKADSHYKLIKREPVQFSKLTIPKSLQAELPYKSKPKLLIKKSEKTVRKQKAKKKIFKIMSKEEKQINVLLQQLNTIKNLKLTTKLKKKRKFFASLRATELMPPAEEADQRRAKELEKDEAKALKRQKAWKKQINRKRSKREGVARRKSASAS
ncbi:hypothetical protein Zmor_016365 [Zophobas morio]|uniref:Ribosome biogenesis protein BMS1/TSR1 C-terminal domain-containing protein n=1 Tax=Zophobas morio TaxID=2755281 RepID=A0AA38LZ28_9CUCU|nr:hypothetical protein Zmor_016365 [Zophobas morio]